MSFDVIPLGTASAIPTTERHLSATLLRRAGSAYLFDCGEGTQLQLLHAGLRPTRLAAIFITHFHGDHFYGLPGLLSTIALLGRTEPLVIAGPEGIARTLAALPGLEGDGLPFPVVYREVHDAPGAQVVFEDAEVRVTARPLEHRIFTAGYRFDEKPRPGRLDAERARALGVTDFAHFRALKAGEAVTLADGRTVRPDEVVGPERPGASFAYVTDTRPCAGGRALAERVELLYHEATFTHDLLARAVETGHTTAAEAAQVAHAAGAGRLLLGHFSARYRDAAPLVEEARTLFPNTEAARELVPYAV